MRPVGGMLSEAETFNVGVLSTAFGGPYFGELMAGMATELAFTGGKMIAIQTVDAGTVEQDFPEPPPFPHHVGWDYVGGFVVVLNGVGNDYLWAARDSGRPVVVISDVPPGFDCPVVVPDNFGGTCAATQHLIDHGHVRVGFVGFPGSSDVHERIQAYQKTMADNGLTPDPDLLFVADDLQEGSGERAARMMLERGMPATAVLTGNDRNAIGLIRALTNVGLDLPNDLAVIGFDDNEAGACLSPALTSVRQPLEEIGALAVRLLIQMRGGEEVPSRKHVVSTSLTVRESCGCAGVVRIASNAVETELAGTGLDSVPSLATLLATWHAGSRYLNYTIDFVGLAAAIDDVLRFALTGAGRLAGLVLRKSLVPLAEMLQDGEGFAEIVRLIRRHAWQLQSAAGLDRDLDVTHRMEGCLREIFLLLAQAQIVQLSRRAQSMMSSLGVQYSVSLQLLRSQEKDPRSLDWLQATDVRAGCLGLWPEREPSSGKRASLTVVGRFDRENGGTGGPNELVPLTAFPPAELVSLADVTADHMVYIAHLKVGPGDWGMLAVVGPIQAYVHEGRETMNQWAALLSVALEHEALLKTMREQEEHLRRAALYDELTGLPNRAHFRTRLTAAMARRSRHSDYKYAVLMLDLDGFKIVNDSLGHHAGDLLLQQVAIRLTTTLRSLDTAARFGGDEFAILLEDFPDDNGPVVVAERLQRVLAQPHLLGDTEVVVSVSIGITAGTTEYDDTEAIMRDADVAMYHAKTHGKRSHAIFDPVMHNAATDRLTIESDLRKALHHRELVLFYQPVVELRTLTVRGAEALIRWRHPTRGLVPPNEFLSVAEESGLSLSIGTWVLEESCRQMRRWGLHRSDARPFTMSVNVSNRQFWQSSLIEDVDDSLRTYGLSPDRLAVEITEGVIMDDVKVASSMLSGLRTLGVQVHIDDFGTGYSSLEALHDLAIDAFKIDRSFISRIATSPRSEELVRTIVTMGLNLNLDVIAEGIETDEQLDFVRRLRCPHGQGYLFSRPVPAEEFARLLDPGS